MKHVNLPQWRTANDLDKTLTQFALMKNYQTLKFHSMHCFVESLILLFIVRMLTYFITTLSLHLKHLALSIY